MTQKITMGRDKRQDSTDAANALRNVDMNPNVFGIGNVVKNTRTFEGNVRVMPQEVADPTGNFAQPDTAANAPLEDPLNQTGSQELARSESAYPGEMTEMAPDRLEQKLAMYRKALGNKDDNLNIENTERGLS